MKHSDLLVAVADLEPIGVTGVFQRHCSLRWDGLRASASGGRWGARAAFEVLYLGRPPESVIVEAYRHLVEDELDEPAALAAAVVERRLFTLEVAVENVLDLRPNKSRQQVALSEDNLRSHVGDYARCQAIGAAAHQLGLNGVLAPAATGLGETLALYPENLPVQDWPVITDTDIWRQLPADPRQLRLADDAS